MSFIGLRGTREQKRRMLLLGIRLSQIESPKASSTLSKGRRTSIERQAGWLSLVAIVSIPANNSPRGCGFAAANTTSFHKNSLGQF